MPAIYHKGQANAWRDEVRERFRAEKEGWVGKGGGCSRIGSGRQAMLAACKRVSLSQVAHFMLESC